MEPLTKRLAAALGPLVENPTGLAVAAIALIGVGGGLLLSVVGQQAPSVYVWTAGTLPALVALAIEIVRSLRRADVGLDIIALLSMSSALAFGEPLAANVVALMYSGGQLLELYAEGRARKEMTALLGRVARTAMRRDGAGLEEVPIEAIRAGDTILIRHGEVLPVDGLVGPDHVASLDLSALTGESLPQRVSAGGDALSGATSMGPAFELIAARPAAESAYAQIVKLVAAAGASKSPSMRLADRFSLAFLGLTIVLAVVAYVVSQDPTRAVAVLVVATPCPLILAVPIAFISGISRAARLGVLVKSAAVLEMMARVKVVILDKTGTVTRGVAQLSRIRPAAGFSEDEILGYAASLDQASSHVLAATLIAAARAGGLVLSAPTNVAEVAGSGIEGTVGAHRIALGGTAFVAARTSGAVAESGDADGMATISVAIDGRWAGEMFVDDPLREDALATLAELRGGGVDRLLLASGDKPRVVAEIGQALGIDDVRGGLTPSQKVEIITAARQFGPTLMVGDGVNDAPALAAADVGVAMGARGSAASSETAGAVMLVDRLSPLPKALAAARRARRIAMQSVAAGLGLSTAAMIVAALGYLPPVEGAMLQELIDVAVIFNALRALR